MGLFLSNDNWSLACYIDCENCLVHRSVAPEALFCHDQITEGIFGTEYVYIYQFHVVL